KEGLAFPGSDSSSKPRESAVSSLDPERQILKARGLSEGVISIPQASRKPFAGWKEVVVRKQLVMSEYTRYSRFPEHAQVNLRKCSKHSRTSRPECNPTVDYSAANDCQGRFKFLVDIKTIDSSEEANNARVPFLPTFRICLLSENGNRGTATSQLQNAINLQFNPIFYPVFSLPNENVFDFLVGALRDATMESVTPETRNPRGQESEFTPVPSPRNLSALKMSSPAHPDIQEPRFHTTNIDR
ncbi:unnamed protein product, partial [Ranitomeya imitator]